MQNPPDFQNNIKDVDVLQREYDKLLMEYKKTIRALDLAKKQIERNKATSEAKDNLSKVISEKRSELERYMNLLLGNCPDIILLFDQDNCLIYGTESFIQACRIPGFGIIRGVSCVELFAPYTSLEFQLKVNDVLKNVFQRKEAVGFSSTVDFSKCGNSRSYNIHVTPMLDKYSGVEGVMLIMTDTTDILAAKREAERANAAKSDFIATVSHEIRTPLNAIIGLANMLKNTSLNNRQQEYLQNLQESSQVLLNLINDTLDFSKIESGKLEIIPEYFKLTHLLTHLQKMFEMLFLQKSLNYVFTFDDDLPEVVYGDDKRIKQILTNILNNALKYTKYGSVCFSVHKLTNGQIEFRVTDTGIGMQEDAIPRIFSTFEQLDLIRNKGVVGTGLGLAITKRLCDLMNGSIDVESTYGEGSRFSVVLNLPEGSISDLPCDDHLEMPAFKVFECRALLVDDIEINLQIAAYQLEQYGIGIDYARNGKEAIEKAMDNYYDIIFMDHMMPEMDGIEATSVIRTMNDYTAAVPIVALSANAVGDAVKKFYASGFTDFLAKPIDEIALARCLLRWLPSDKVQVSKD